MAFVFITAAASAAPAPPPAVGALLSLVAASNRSLALRQCNGAAAFTPVWTPVDGADSDHALRVVAPLNGRNDSAASASLCGMPFQIERMKVE